MSGRKAIAVSLLAAAFLLSRDSVAKVPSSRRQRMEAVESSLIPYVPVRGLPPWKLDERMAFYRVPGLTVAVIRNYKIDWIKSFGQADLSRNIPATTSTLYSAGSISKLVNAVAVMKMVQDGKVSLDQPVNGYLKSWQIPENDLTRRTPVTLRMLLSHTAGTTQSAFFGFQPGQTLPTTLQSLRGLPPSENNPVVVNSAPAKEFRYSGGGVLISQLVLEDVTGMDYPRLLEDQVFKPLGLTSSTFVQPLPELLQRRAAWAYSENSWFRGVPYVYPQSAAAGLYTNAGDLARIVIEMQNAYRGKNAHLLSQASVKEMTHPQTLVSEGYYREDAGLGCFLVQARDNHNEPAGIYFEHSGVNAGFTADAMGSLIGGNGIVVLANKDGGAIDLIREIRRSVASVYEWPRFLPEEVVPMPLNTSTLDGLSGRYRRSKDEVISFRRDNGLLIEKINSGPDIVCAPLSATTCMLTDFHYVGSFQVDRAGRAQSFEVSGLSKPMPRLADDDLLPNELLRLGRIPEAIEGYRALKLNEFQLSQMANDWMFSGSPDLLAADALLRLAAEQFPQSPLVNRTRGTLAEKQRDPASAIAFYKRTLELNPEDRDAAYRLKALER